MSEEEARALYEDFYRDATFTFVASKNVDLKQVTNTNKALVWVEKHGSKLMIVSVIDNLLKGASGQAVQNMNIMCGFDECEGLRLKPNAF
jgi:N-acetyl-gamma-glutamyl-phosphate reductase